MRSSDLQAYALGLATRIVGGGVPTTEELRELATAPDDAVAELFPGIALLRAKLAPQGVHLCSIRNVKSGHCSEDCRFCTQARASTASVEVYPLVSEDDMGGFLIEHSTAPLNRAALVASGRRLSALEVTRVAEALRLAARARESTTETRPFCASLGLLDEQALGTLKAAGLSRYHCNLETARSHFPSLCTTHTFDEKVDTIRAAQRVGLSVCVGGLFGVGESDLQVLELALELRALAPDAVPVNFLVSVPGAALDSAPNLTPERCLKIIALLRFVLPRQDILVCGGRVPNLRERHTEIFRAGASGLMTGNYLTTLGRTLQEDLQLLDDLGDSPRAARLHP